MLLCMHYLRESYDKFCAIEDRLIKELEIQKKRQQRELEGRKNRDRKDPDFEEIKRRFNEAFTDLFNVLQEAKMFEGDRRAQSLSGLVASSKLLYDMADSADTYQTLQTVNSNIILQLKDFISSGDYSGLSEFVYPWDFAKAYGAYGQGVVMDRNEAITFTELIDWSNGANVLDLDIRDDTLSDCIRVLNEESQIYGLNTHRCAGKKENYKRLIYGGIKGASISQSTFDVVICNPKISIEKVIMKGVLTKAEREFLVKATEYLRPGGVILFGIPYYRFYKDICDHFCKFFDHIQIFKSTIETPGIVYVMAQKRDSDPLVPADYNRSHYRLLRQLPFTYSTFCSEPLNKYILPRDRIPVLRFRGAELDEDELIEAYENSTATKAFWQSQTVKKTDMGARPLLPFNVGQLGLILTSGCLDGIIQEDNDCCHAVKGRVVKKNYSTETGRRNGEIQLTTTSANRVEINIFLPDGTYKSLA